MLELITGVIVAIITSIVGPIIYDIWKRRQELPASTISQDIKQVLENVYHVVLERELDSKGLNNYGMQLQRRDKNLRMIIKEIGSSEEYLNRFVRLVSPQQAVRLIYLHFLCREPESEDIVREHVDMLNERGWQYVIGKIVDSEEYLSRFGEHSVPHRNM